MKIYEDVLTLKKTTQKMGVYGNDVLSAQYLPKALFADGKNLPEKVTMSLAVLPPPTAVIPTAEGSISKKAKSGRTVARKGGK
jgi:hypothetical protein